MASLISQYDVVNQLVSNYQFNDKKVSDLFGKISTLTSALEDDTLSMSKRYETILTTEYLLFRIRVIVENESVLIKQLLSLTDDVKIKSILTRRDICLSQISSKVTSLQNDVSIVQKLNYSYNLK